MVFPDGHRGCIDTQRIQFVSLATVVLLGRVPLGVAGMPLAQRQNKSLVCSTTNVPVHYGDKSDRNDITFYI